MFAFSDDAARRLVDATRAVEGTLLLPGHRRRYPATGTRFGPETAAVSTSGTTTDDYVTIVDIAGGRGHIAGVATLQNTDGANGLYWYYRVVGGQDTIYEYTDQLLAAGASKTFDVPSISPAHPSPKAIRIRVKSSSAGNAATFDLRGFMVYD